MALIYVYFSVRRLTQNLKIRLNKSGLNLENDCRMKCEVKKRTFIITRRLLRWYLTVKWSTLFFINQQDVLVSTPGALAGDLEPSINPNYRQRRGALNKEQIWQLCLRSFLQLFELLTPISGDFCTLCRPLEWPSRMLLATKVLCKPWDMQTVREF